MYGRAMVHGRLADPDCTLGTDPRSDPRMVQAFRQLGIDGHTPIAPLTVDSPLEDKRAFAAMNEEVVGAVLAAFGQAVPDVEGVTTTTTTITGEDGNDVTLYISRPDTAGPLPALVHLHGGRSAVRRTSATPRVVNISLPQGLSSSVSSSATRQASSVRTRIRLVSTTARPVSDGRTPTAAVWVHRTWSSAVSPAAAI
jgi:hypothetical protein